MEYSFEELWLSAPLALARLSGEDTGCTEQERQGGQCRDLPCMLLFEFSISSDKDTMSGCWR